MRAIAERHRLRRDLVATIVANAVANRLGCAALARLTMAADPVAACRAALLAAEAFGLEAACDAIDAAAAPAETRLAALLSLRRLQEAAAQDLLGGAGAAAGGGAGGAAAGHRRAGGGRCRAAAPAGGAAAGGRAAGRGRAAPGRGTGRGAPGRAGRRGCRGGRGGLGRRWKRASRWTRCAARSPPRPHPAPSARAHAPRWPRRSAPARRAWPPCTCAARRRTAARSVAALVRDAAGARDLAAVTVAVRALARVG